MPTTPPQLGEVWAIVGCTASLRGRELESPPHQCGVGTLVTLLQRELTDGAGEPRRTLAIMRDSRVENRHSAEAVSFTYIDKYIRTRANR